MPWSGLVNTIHGLNLSAEISPKPWLVQVLQWDLAWRNLKAQTSHPTFASRTQMGHSLKSSLINKLTINTLDDNVLPTRGVHLQLGQELAGLGLGNVGYLRTMANGSIFQQINNLIVGGKFELGYLSPISIKDTYDPNVGPEDKYFPKVRGFANHRVGFREDSGRTYLGSNAFWKVSLHAMTSKLPFLRGQSWIVQNIRGHAFAEMFNVSEKNSENGSFVKWLTSEPLRLKESSRLSVGFGILAKLGKNGQAELNYCFPLRYVASHDTINSGLQFSLNAVIF